MPNYKIVAADDDRGMIETIKIILKAENYDVIVANDGATALKKIQEEKPDLVLLDYDMPQMNGYEVCKSLKASLATRYIPIIMLSGVRVNVYDKIVALKAGADDYITKPFDMEEFRTRVERLILRTKEIISLNPLTKLPGSTRIEEEIVGRLGKNEKFAVGYVDLDHFKAYNDFYGYKKGDNVIHLLHEVIFEGISLCGTRTDFIGHIGGDDFIIVTSIEKVDEACTFITKNFDQRIPAYYNLEEREKGFIVTADRLGKESKFPLMTVSIGIASNEKRPIAHYGELIDILIEMKKYTKSLEQRNGSTFAKDRRISRMMHHS